MKHLTLTAIDVGGHAVIGLTARKHLATGEIEILAKSEASCFGVRNGEVTRPEHLAKAILAVKNELGQGASLKIKNVLTNVSGCHLSTQASQGLVSVSRADQKISQEDVQRVLRAARAVNLPSNKEILATLPREFIIDGEGGIKQPIGLNGVRLEAKVLLVCLFTPVLENLGRSFAEADLAMAEVIASPIASSRAILSNEQKEVGVALLDIGAGTTSLSVFDKGDLAGFAVFPIGSANITNDIAIGLRTEISTAEKIKLAFANLENEPKMQRGKIKQSFSERAEIAKEKITLPEKELVFNKSFLRGIVQARILQIFNEAEKSLKKIIASQELPCGIVLTGGGANLPGIVSFAKDFFELPCSLGQIRELPQANKPQMAVCSGLLLNAFDDFSGAEAADQAALPIGILKRFFRLFLP